MRKNVSKTQKKRARSLKKNPRSSRKITPRPAPRLLKRTRVQKYRKSLQKFEIQHSNFPRESLFSDSQSTFGLEPRYQDNKIVLLVRDPWWIYAYWEVTLARQTEVRAHIQRQGLSQDKTVLRVYDAVGAWFDIEAGFADNWHIDVGAPDSEWVAELGIRTREGPFFAWVRSNKVRTPRFGISDVIDEEWMLPEDLYWKLFGLSGGLAHPRSSLEVQEVMRRYLRSLVSSPAPVP